MCDVDGQKPYLPCSSIKEHSKFNTLIPQRVKEKVLKFEDRNAPAEKTKQREDLSDYSGDLENSTSPSSF